MARLQTMENLLAKSKRLIKVEFKDDNIGRAIEKVYDLAFAVGMKCHSDFLDEITYLPQEDSVKELEAMEEELLNYINGFDPTNDDGRPT